MKEEKKSVSSNSRPSVVVNVSKLMKGDPNKAAKKLEEDAKKLFQCQDKATAQKGEEKKRKKKKVKI